MDPSTQQQQQQQHHHLHQEMGSDQTLESMLECRKDQQQEKKAIRPAEESLKCPRCDSTNTKFCYYNNYSLTQPRYFCKSCRRYWTKGGTLRNVPVGGGCRKNNKRSSSSSSSMSSSKRAQDQSLISSPNTYNNNPLSSLITGLSSYDQSDQISLAIARLQNQNQNHHFGQMGFEHGYSIFGNNPTPTSDDHVDAMRGGYFENPSLINGFHNQNHQLFGGTGINMGHNENGGGYLRNLGLINGSEEMGIINSSMAAAYGDQETGGNCGIATTSTAVTTVKQEGENRVLMAGFPWQFGGADQTGNMVDLEPPVKPSWNGFGSSSWHGLLNSPLM